MFFFEEPEVWRQYLEELGIQQMVDNLKMKGFPHEWPTMVYGPEQGATYHPGGGKYHPSPCPCYEGYWWAGGFGAVRCRASEELLPGSVYENVCAKGYERCPFHPKEE